MKTMTRIAAAIAVTLGVAMLANCWRATANSDTRGSIESGGRERTYEVHVPTRFTESQTHPLVLALHGRLGDGHGMAMLTHFDAVADEHGFIVVYPDGWHRSWADGRGSSPSDKEGVNDVQFLADLMEKMERDYRVDPKRIYVVGISNGGFMSLRVACELADRVAAVGVDAATLSANTAAACHPSQPVPVMIIHGTKDPLVPIAGGELGRNGSHGLVLSHEETIRKWLAIDGCRGQAARTEIPDDSRRETPIPARIWEECAAGAEVRSYVVEGGGHTWPGGKQYLPAAFIGKTARNMDASEAYWGFFEKHPL